jgi:opacity protein-like surface antigen
MVLAVPAFAQGMGDLSARSTRWEMTLGPRFQFGQTVEFGNQTEVVFDDDFAWGFTINYNLNERIAIGTDFGWNFIDYRASFITETGGPGGAPVLDGYNGSGEASNWMFNATYTLLPKRLSPFVMAGVGWGWFDTNISSGDVSTGCFWDPFYGYICTSYPTTYGTDALVYRGGAGLRYDASEAFFMKVFYNAQWTDLGEEMPPFQQIRVDFGALF